MTDPTVITWKTNIHIDDLVIPSSNIDDLGGEEPRRANNKARGGALNCKNEPICVDKVDSQANRP